MKCRACGSAVSDTFCDLGMSPVSNAFVPMAAAQEMEPLFPLHAMVCRNCLLVQLAAFQPADEIFDSEYAYFSSYSQSWLDHARAYVEMMIERFELSSDSQVIELASNDGYLLQYFREQAIPVLGVEPTENTAAVAREKGIPTRVEFFGEATAQKIVDEGIQADVLLGNNVLAHVPDLHDFVGGMKRVLKPDGVLTMEFPHLLCLMRESQFDTIYHEHFSYLSWLTVARVFGEHGITLFDVERLPTHGGSLRIFGRHVEDTSKPVTERALALRDEELAAGLDQIETYHAFQQQARAVKREFLKFLISAKEDGKQVAAYGAPAKGNTLLNFCGVGTDFIDYTVDRSPHKQNCFLPGVRIPVFAPEKIRETRPDYVVILPWNLRDEIISQLHYIREWGGRFVVPIPRLEVVD